MTPQTTNERRTSRERLIEAGRGLFWNRGFNDVGLNEILRTAGVPKGSFYHHFESKEGFGLEVVDAFAADALEAFDSFLEADMPPLERMRLFFAGQRSFYEENGCCDGCLMGNFGQELAETSESLRVRVDSHMAKVKRRIQASLEEAKARGDIDSRTDIEVLADILLSGWHGALLRMKVEKSLKPIDSFLAFHFPSGKS